MLDRLRRFTRWNRVYGGASSRSNVLRPSRPMTRHPALLLLLTTLFIGGHQATAGRQAAAQEPPKLNLAGELQALGGLDSGLAGDLGLGEGETLTLNATLKAVEGGPAGILELDATIAADWHLYSLTQPPGGPLRTKLELQATPPLELTGTWKASQPPKVRRVPEYPGVDLEEHSDKVTWTVPVKLPPGANPDKYAVRVKLSGLTCRDNDSCLPVKLTANVKLVGFRSGAAGEGPVPAAGGATATDDAAGKNAAGTNAAGTNAAGTNSAEKDAAPAPPAATNRPAPPQFTGKPGPYRAMLSHGEIDGHVTTNAIGPGGMVSLVLTAKPQPGWHFYTVAETDPEDGSPFKPTLLAIDLPPGWSRSAVVASKSTVSKAVPGKPPAVFYEGEVSWSVELRAPASVAAGPQEIRGILAYQTCDDRSCDRPTGVAFRAVVELASDDYSFRVLFRASEERALEGRASEEHERIEEFDGVIDASGLDMPRFLGESGIPAIGELAARRCDKAPWRNVPPDLAGIDLETFCQQRIVIVGETLDAALSLRSACELSERFPQTRVTWITRRLVDVVDVDSPGPIEEPTGDFGDAVLQLIRDTNALARSPNRVQLLSGTAIHAMRAMERESNAAPWRLELIGKHAGTLECDWLLGHVGFRVDERITSELHVRRCPARDRVLGDALDIAMNPSRHRVSASDGVIAEPHYHVIGNKRAGKPLGVTFAQCLEQIQRLFAILGDRPSLNLYANRKPNRDG